MYTLLGDPNAVRFLSSSRLEASIGFITLCALLSTLYDDLYDLSPAANEAQGIVQPFVYIDSYNLHDPDSSPIAIESRKLVFLPLAGRRNFGKSSFVA